MISELFHYYRKGFKPFQSLSALPEDQADPPTPRAHYIEMQAWKCRILEGYLRDYDH